MSNSLPISCFALSNDFENETGTIVFASQLSENPSGAKDSYLLTSGVCLVPPGKVIDVGDVIGAVEHLKSNKIDILLYSGCKDSEVQLCTRSAFECLKEGRFPDWATTLNLATKACSVDLPDNAQEKLREKFPQDSFEIC